MATKNVPTNKALYSRVKSEAKRKFKSIRPRMQTLGL